MRYETELNFFQDFLRNLHVSCRVVKNYSECISEMDMVLRRMINPTTNLEKRMEKLFEICAPNTVYRILDEFTFHYLFFQIPDTDTPTFIIVGPYVVKELTNKDILANTQKYSLTPDEFSQVEIFFYSTPVISMESGLLTLVNTLGETIWGSIDNFSMHDINTSSFSDIEPVAKRPDTQEPMDAFLSMKVLEDRYSIENQLIQAISQGQIHKAEMMADTFGSYFQMEVRASDPVRNMKNYLVIANTLFRKAAEIGAVHPLHIDSLSTKFAHEIEYTTSTNELTKIARNMIRKYCLLVKNHSMKGYSLLIRKVLVRIDSDLTADLSLKAQADFLDVNPSYLSTLFKKETGATLTEYVNRKRVEHGIFLLNSTQLQIQLIAQYCGIPDVNYFTKTFKKIVGQTPKEYRNNIMPYVRASDKHHLTDAQ